MEKNIYIPGDLVKVGAYDGKVVKLEDVQEKGEIGWYDEEKGEYDFCIPQNASPIPLTPAILEKNGWKKKDEYNEYFYIPRSEDFELLGLDKIREEWYIHIEEDDSNFDTIKYVHQLQHLLFGLGLKSEMEV